ncbi:MAG: DUF1761 domain-containing protein [Candidatus Rokubacteria bacterium]|nr:DUF1761 domain-containing protein [Candidatus Rokubacteria bacterium]
MAPKIEISLAAVLAAAVANMAVGAVWYSPLVCGKRWLAAMGWSQQELARRKQQGLSKAYGGTFLASLVLAYFLAHGVEFMGASTLLEGAHVGFWVWLGFVATTSLGAYLFEGRSLALYLINAGGSLAGLLVMGSLLAVG